MDVKKSRRTFFKNFLSLSAFSAASILSFKRIAGDKICNIGPTETYAMDDPDYDALISAGEIRIEYRGMSCFLITTSNGTKIVTDPFHADGQILHSELRRQPADVITVSCGNYAHCYVWSVGGMPYIFKRTEPAELKGIKFRGVASRHLEMKDVGTSKAGDNFIICFEVEGIKICHLGALGHKLTDEQVKEIGKVDILMVPVGGVSTLPVKDASAVCDQLNPKVIIPMHYKTERCTYSSWATVDEFRKLRTKDGGIGGGSGGTTGGAPVGASGGAGGQGGAPGGAPGGTGGQGGAPGGAGVQGGAQGGAPGGGTGASGVSDSSRTAPFRGGFGIKTFKASELPSETQVIVLGYPI